MQKDQSRASVASGNTTEVDGDVERNVISPNSEFEKPMDPRGTGGPPGGDNGLYQPKSLKFWLILICNFLALFLVALDRTIISTAVPRITDEFHSLDDIGWYGSAYMLTTAASQLLFGRIYKFYDMKWTFMLSVIAFEIGSTICGAAPNSTVFIVGRAIAGLASAGIFTGTMMIMIPMVPLHRRPMFQGLFGMVFGIASVLGPLIGGGFTEGVSWRWCFYINLPVGGATLLFMFFFWNPPAQEHAPVPLKAQIMRLDPLGTFFFLPGCVSLLLALQWGGATYAWENWRICLLFALAAVLLLAFAAVQVLMPKTATIPGRIIKQRSVLFGALFTFFLAGSMLMMVFYVPVWFQTVKAVNPLKSGIYTLPLVLSLVASSILSGFVTAKIGYYVPSMILAGSIMPIGEGLMSTFAPETPSSHWIAFQFLAGFGLGFGMQTGGLAVQTVLPKEDVSTGVAIIFFMQQLGGAVFTSVGQSILSNYLVTRLSGLPVITHPEAIVNQGATELAALVPPEDLPLVIDAYNFACTRIFLAAMAVAFCSLLCAFCMEWKSVKKGKGSGGPPGGPSANGKAGPNGDTEKVLTGQPPAADDERPPTGPPRLELPQGLGESESRGRGFAALFQKASSGRLRSSGDASRPVSSRTTRISPARYLQRSMSTQTE